MTDSSSDSDCGQRLEDLLSPALFKALGDANRLALLVRLARCGRPCSVSELNECCPVDLSVVSRHLAVLRDAGVVRAERQGKEVHYSLAGAELAALLRATAEALEACWCAASPGARPPADPESPAAESPHDDATIGRERPGATAGPSPGSIPAPAKRPRSPRAARRTSR